MKKLLTICVVVDLLVAGSSSADILWGVTNGTGDGGFWSGGEIFEVDTSNGSTTVKATYSSSTLDAFGDIALRGNGEVYVTYSDTLGTTNEGFDKLAKVNTSTWAFDWVYDLGGYHPDPNGIAQVNALTFIGDTLYAITGGGTTANLLEITLGSAGPSSITSLGPVGVMGINSDGDLAIDPTDDKVYATFWDGRPASGSSFLDEIVIGTPPTTIGGPNLHTTGPVDYTGVAGLEFTPDGTLWAGTYWDEQLVTVDKAAGLVTPSWDLSATLGGTITGLSIPEPATLALLACGALTLFHRRRR